MIHIMKKLNATILGLFLIIISCQKQYAQGHEIVFQFKHVKDTTIYIGHYLGSYKGLVVDDTIAINKKGYGMVKGINKLAPGLHFVYITSSQRFDLLIDYTEQYFSVAIDTTKLIESLEFKHSDQNKQFYDYITFIQNKRKELNKLHEKRKSDKENKQIEENIKSLNNEVMTYVDKIVADNKGKYISKYVTGLTKEIDVPDSLKGNDRYYFVKKHYFDKFDIRDQRMVRTPFAEDRIKQYLNFTKQLPPDTLISDADWLMAAMRGDEELFRFMMITLFQHYGGLQNIMGMDAVYTHIADRYIIPKCRLDSTYIKWKDPEFLEKLIRKVILTKQNILGGKAANIQMIQVPDEHFREIKNDTSKLSEKNAGTLISLYDINTKFTIVFFWEADCSHCKKATPKLYEIYERLKDKGLEVMSVHMLNDMKEWASFINKKELYDWINVWNPGNHQYKVPFGIESSPVLYLLDKDKKIIAKRISPEQAENVIVGKLLEEKYKSLPDGNKVEETKKYIEKEFFNITQMEYISNIGKHLFKKEDSEELTEFIKELMEKLIQPAMEDIMNEYKDEEMTTKLKHYIDGKDIEASLPIIKEYAEKKLKKNEKEEILTYIDLTNELENILRNILYEDERIDATKKFIDKYEDKHTLDQLKQLCTRFFDSGKYELHRYIKDRVKQLKNKE